MNNEEENRNELSNISKLETMMAQLIEMQTDGQKTMLQTNKKVERLSETVDVMNARVSALETSEEITYSQQNTIDSLVSQIVYERLGISGKPSEWTIEERTINQKYGKLFRKRLRKEVSSKGHLAYPFRTTQKGNFKQACEDIEAWYPRNGIDALKREADDNALARRIAREQGYE